MMNIGAFKKETKIRIAAYCFTAAMFAVTFTAQSARAADLPASGAGLLGDRYDVLADRNAGGAALSFKRGKIVRLAVEKSAGTIIVNTRTNVLYYTLGDGQAVQYRVATAKPGFGWSGTHKVSAKAQWPDWRPPVEMRKRRPELPTFMAGGPENPLGARALYLGSSIYRIHGTNDPKSIGKASSSGCIRMLNADVEELYRHVRVGTPVIVL